ncbi:helix-turn-helix domain-containing protein [Acinetobacter pittii]|uniref:helix-turn-helix domain-containing protein n=1 Tax=Acinetobacter pittii TaxID=48296 RepID=UPI003B42D830
MVLSERELELRDTKRDIGAEILQGIADMKANNAAKRTVVKETDVSLARRKSKLNQAEFAKMLNIPKRTLEAWEQGKRRPSGAAQTLIKLCLQDPERIKEMLV